MEKKKKPAQIPPPFFPFLQQAKKALKPNLAMPEKNPKQILKIED